MMLNNSLKILFLSAGLLLFLMGMSQFFVLETQLTSLEEFVRNKSMDNPWSVNRESTLLSETSANDTEDLLILSHSGQDILWIIDKVHQDHLLKLNEVPVDYVDLVGIIDSYEIYDIWQSDGVIYIAKR